MQNQVAQPSGINAAQPLPAPPVTLGPSGSQGSNAQAVSLAHMIPITDSDIDMSESPTKEQLKVMLQQANLHNQIGMTYT